MGSNSTKSLGAIGRDDLFYFTTDQLTWDHPVGHPLYDERSKLPIDEALVKNIMVYGVLDPIDIRKNGEREDGTPIIDVVDGRQRVKNAAEANRRLVAAGCEPVRIPAKRTRGDDAYLFGIMVSKNEHRQNDQVTTKANKAQRLLSMGKSYEEVAITFGVDPQTIKNWLTILDVTAPVRNAYEAGKITMGDVKSLAKVAGEEQSKKLDELVAAAPKTPGKRRAKARLIAGVIIQKPPSRKDVTAIAEEAGRHESAPGNKHDVEARSYAAGFQAALLWWLGQKPLPKDFDVLTKPEKKAKKP